MARTPQLLPTLRSVIAGAALLDSSTETGHVQWAPAERTTGAWTRSRSAVVFAAGTTAVDLVMPKPYVLACHCNAIRIEVDADLTTLRDCNCSVCARSGFLHWYVPASTTRLLTPSPPLSTYVWRHLGGSQHFCPACGTAILRTGYLNHGQRCVSVNARCLEGVDVFALDVERFDGRNEVPPGPMEARV
jgi:hypothetical protein